MNFQSQISNLKFPMFLLLFGIWYLGFGILNKAFADGTSIGVYPPIFQITATPPANVEAPFTIENQADTSINLNIDLRPFIPSDQENGQVQYVSPKDANFKDPLILQRVQILDPNNKPINSVSLSPKQQKKLTLIINVPKDEPASDYYFSILFLTNSQINQSSSGSTAQSGIASNVLLSIGDNLGPKGTIQEFSGPVFVEKGPFPFTVRVKNTGQNFITPHGDILIKNLFGQTVGRVDLAQVNVLSQSVRNIPSIDYLDENQSFSEDIPAAYWKEKILLGFYKATLTLAVSDQGPIYQRDIYFIALPLKYSITGGIIILLLIYVIAKVKSRV